MRLFGKKQPKIKGSIGYFQLEDWWLSTFIENERVYIEDKYRPMGASIGSLTKEDREGVYRHGYSGNRTPAHFLGSLGSWFHKSEHDRDIARRILNKAIQLGQSSGDVLALHFGYQFLIKVWYRDRDMLPNALEEAIKACQGQIAIAPQAVRAFKKAYPKHELPTHYGYGQLITIYGKQKKYDWAIQVAERAKKEGWKGDWDHTIDRYKKKLDKGG